MQIYQGIQLVYTHVVQLIQSIGVWFEDIIWANLIELYPLSLQPVIQSCLIIILAMAAIGLVKKMSFLLG